jgi:two-component system response regulator YesN
MKGEKVHMIRVIIADDEEKICRLIDHLIDWSSLNMELVGVAENGIEAYAMIEELNPDLVITDIRMPGYDGLELLKRARNYNPNIEFIIISGYSQFEYAQTAIRYGVKDYLLKPIKKQQLWTTLKEVENRYYKLYEAEKINKIQREQIRRNEGQLRVNWMRALAEGDNEEKLESVNHKYGYHFQPGVFQIIFIRADLLKNESMRMASLSKTMEILYEKAAVMLKESLAGKCYDVEICTVNNAVIGLINYSQKESGNVRLLLKSFIKDFGVEINIFEEIQFRLSVSEADKCFFDLKVKIDTAQKVMEERVFKRQGIFLENIPEQVDWDAESVYKRFSSEVRQSMDIQNLEHIKKAIGELKQLVSDNKISGFQVLKTVCDAYHLFLVSSLFQKEYYFGNREEMERDFEKKVFLCSNVDNIFQLLEAYCIRDLDESCSRINQKKIKPINQAKQYIQEHYMEPLTLEELGDVVGFSGSYFSTVFRKETGKTFLEYLTEIRIEEAKQILIETSLTIESVSQEIGMNDYKRFSKIFRKQTGITPKEYRNLYS